MITPKEAQAAYDANEAVLVLIDSGMPLEGIRHVLKRNNEALKELALTDDDAFLRSRGWKLQNGYWNKGNLMATTLEALRIEGR